MPSSTPPPSTTPRRVAPIAIVFAVPLEADAFERLAVGRVETRAGPLLVHEGTVAGVRVVWCVAGAGTAAAARAARLLIDGHRPRLLVSAGFAGGLDPALERGSVVRPARAVAVDSEPIDLAHASPEDGAIVTVDRVATVAGEKRRIAESSGARLVDMETYAVAAAARAASLRCAAVRVISDAAEDDLPREVDALVRPQSEWRRMGAAVGAVIRRPRAAVDLWRLYERAVADGRALAAAVAELCRTAAA